MADRTSRARRGVLLLLRYLSALEAVVGSALLVVIFGLVLLQAAQRYLPTGGWVWTGELARFGLVWLTFAMAGYLMERDGHVTLKLIDYLATGVPRRLVILFANVTVAVVCLNLAYEAYELATRPTRQSSPAMGMPIGLLYVIPLAGLLLTATRAVAAVFLPARPDREDEPDRAGTSLWKEPRG